ncbi:MAG: flagellar export chaperone FliS [Deltaproteobacteria bacterium]|jgi:flagellar protein FliS|nr:flagellar export chaperone FliS [Deltaproteobacteria bacterium]
MQKAAHSYMQTNVSTTSPGEIIILLYDGAIKFLNTSKMLIDAKDYAAKGIAISKAMDIISELSAVLNKEKGGELAENLHKLYFWCNTTLAMANLKLDKEKIDSVIKILSGLRSAYAQIQTMPEAQQACAQIAAGQRPEHSAVRNLPGSGTVESPLPTMNSSLRGRAAYSRMSANS